MLDIECFVRQSLTWSHCLYFVTKIYYCLFFGESSKIKITHLLFATSTKYKMKLFVVVISVALVIMFVFATDTAAAPTDYEDTNDMFSITAPVDDVSPYVRTSNSNGHYTKISTKHPLYVVLKTLAKLLMKIFSADNAF